MRNISEDERNNSQEVINNMNDIYNNIQVYFTKDSGLHDINVKSELVDEISIEDGFLKIHDKHENCWHNYNLKHVIHFHLPG